MRCFVCLAVDVPDEDISEQLDLITGALDKAKLAFARATNPCGYDLPVSFIYNDNYNKEIYNALRML